MKKTIITTCAVICLFTASLNAQTDTTITPQQPTTPETPLTGDKWNNPDHSKYQLLPMPAPLTTEKIFPVIGKYELTDKGGAAAAATVVLDETNKGVAWIDGLPQGRIKAYLRKSPAVYKIPAQKTAEEKDVAGGVLIYDKETNTINVCIGCTYNAEDPAIAFVPVETKVDEVEKKAVKKATAKTTKIQPSFYSGSKVVETANAVSMR